MASFRTWGLVCRSDPLSLRLKIWRLRLLVGIFGCLWAGDVPIKVYLGSQLPAQWPVITVCFPPGFLPIWVKVTYFRESGFPGRGSGVKVVQKFRASGSVSAGSNFGD